MSLKDIKIGSACRVSAVGGDKILRRRLLEMGITPGTLITVKKAAPLGDPLELLLRGYVLTLRLEDADKITVEKIQTIENCGKCTETGVKICQ
jgi:Fe2+ transport system protein FeoA